MNDEKVDINRVRELMTSYHKSITQVRRFYERPSYMGLLNVGRKELPHSSFVSWLFDSATFNQSCPDSPIMHLLDIAVKRANQQYKIGDNNAISTSLSDSIYGRLISISSTSCCLEEVIDKRRCDIVIRCKIKDSERDLNICIENKVLSSEHTSQTEAYEQYYSNDENADWLFLFLTPLPSVELDDYYSLSKKERCISEKFIQINYQDLLDYVLEPLINSVDKNSQVYFILDDYINTLRYPVMEDNYKKRTIMAIGEQETKLLNDFWEGNHELIELALEAMSCNPNLADDVRKEAENTYKSVKSLQTAKDSTRYVIIEANQRDDNKEKGYNKVAVAKKFAEKICEKNNGISNDVDANEMIGKLLLFKKSIKNIFKLQVNKTINHNYEIKLENGVTLFLNTNIWGESTDYWRKLREYLEKDNEYFKIESLR